MPQPNTYRFKWWALLGVCLLAFTAFLDVTIVNTALPFIQAAMKATILQLQWVANIFAIALSMSMIAIGKLADRWGRKKVFYFGVSLFGLAALGAGLSESIAELVFFRALQSLGAATVFVSSTALLSHVFPENERVKAISIYAGITGFGLLIGPFVGGILVAFLGWRFVFWVNLPLIAIGLIACSFSLKGEVIEHHDEKMDWASLLLLVVGLGSLLYGIIAGADGGWTALSTWGFLLVGLLALAFLITLDMRGKNTLLNLHIFKNKLIVLAALSCAFAGVASTVFMFFDPLYLRIVRKMSPLDIGWMIAAIPVAQVVISLVFTRLEKSLGVSRLLLFSIAAALLAALLHRTLQEDSPLGWVLVPFFLLGVNWGLSNAALITAVNHVVPQPQIGSALGTLMTTWNVSGAIVLAAATAVFHTVEVHSSFLPAFHVAVNCISGLAVVIFAVAIAAYRAKV